MKVTDEPPGLRRAVERAMRLSESILVDEQLSLLHDEWARAWLAGRSGEIERFVEEVRTAWRAGHADDATAARTLADYLDGLEDGLAKHLGSRASAGRTVIDVEASTTEEDTLRRSVDALLLDLTRRGS
jgi:AcrR family transcriptional regulator